MIEQYINYLTNIKGYSQNTANSYRKDLQHFTKWIKQQRTDVRWSTITMQDIDQYITELAEAGLKPATTNRRLSAISGIYNFFRHQGKQVENPCKWEGRRKIADTIPNTIPVEQLKLAYAQATGVAKVAIGLFMTTGIRIQELLDMTWEDIDFETQAIKIHGKGSKERMVYTTEDKLEVLRQLHTMKPQSGQIFTMEQRQLRTIIFEALRPFCHAPQLSPHAIRHTFATHAANMGANVTTLAQAMGHKRIATTQKYIDLSSAPVRSLMTSYNMFN